MPDRLHRPTTNKPMGSFTRSKDSRPSDGLPAGLRLLEDAQHDVGLAEILAALTSEPAKPDMRLREVEDSIRRHWAVLRNLVREHAELSRASLGGDVVPATRPDRPLPKVAMFTPPAMRSVVAAE